MAYVRDWRSKGGKTALVTATDTALASEIASHLDLFDEVHGSDGDVNLKGENKARFLVDRFGAEGFAYMGDAAADLPVWSQASKAITVNAPPALRRNAEKAAPAVEHIDSEGTAIRPYIDAMRPHQWLKNLLVFLPMLAAQQFDGGTILQALLAFICFSLVASSVYVLNDLLDLAADRAHPRKRFRPFAAGTIPIAHGTVMAGGLLLLGAVIALILGGKFLLLMVAYYVLTTAYSVALKRRLIIDICVLAGLYTMRILAGGAATGLELSVWLLAFSVFIFLSLAAVKRQAELIDTVARGKLEASGHGYQVDDLPIISMIAIGAGYVSVMVLTLYVNSPKVLELYGLPEMLWGVCAIMLYWVTRMVMKTHRGEMNDDPIVFAITDNTSRICLAVMFTFVILGTVL